MFAYIYISFNIELEGLIPSKDSDSINTKAYSVSDVLKFISILCKSVCSSLLLLVSIFTHLASIGHVIINMADMSFEQKSKKIFKKR